MVTFDADGLNAFSKVRGGGGGGGGGGGKGRNSVGRANDRSSVASKKDWRTCAARDFSSSSMV